MAKRTRHRDRERFEYDMKGKRQYTPGENFTGRKRADDPGHMVYDCPRCGEDASYLSYRCTTCGTDLTDTGSSSQ